MTPLYIFDLDGTLALIQHRRHFVEGERKDWRAFFAACVDDEPNWPIIWTLHALRRGGAEVWIWSGRSDEVKEQTVSWLKRYGLWRSATWLDWLPAPESFRMRRAGDHRPDDDLKREWASEIEPPEWKRLTATFDDRDRVVKMWRDLGVCCIQVAPGDF